MARLKETAAERLVLSTVHTGKAAAGVFPTEDSAIAEVDKYLALNVRFEDGRCCY